MFFGELKLTGDLSYPIKRLNLKLELVLAYKNFQHLTIVKSAVMLEQPKMKQQKSVDLIIILS